jgi:hypothetical protein
MTTREKVIVGVVAFVVAPVLYAWVLQWLWPWFVVPFGAPLISMPWAYGLALLGKLMVGVRNTKNEHGFGWTVALALLVPLMYLGLGWLAHQFMVG